MEKKTVGLTTCIKRNISPARDLWRATIYGLLWMGALLTSAPLFGQQVRVELGPDRIGANQSWQITATIQGASLKSYSGFPDIEGFQKGGASTQSETRIINGKVSSSQSVAMRYLPSRGQGTFTVPPFTLKINGVAASSSGKKIQVGPPVKISSDPLRRFFDDDPVDSFFGRRKNTEFIDVKDDALLALTTDKSKVYVGEGFTTTLSFLVANDNRAPMQFHSLGKQLARILKKIKPPHCWEENLNIEDIRGEPITLSNKSYMRYKIYQATFYPLNAQPVRFPSVGLEMIKFKVAKNPTFFGQNRKEAYKTFYSAPRTVRVIELPPHPLRESVAVGDYRLNETLSAVEAKTGQSVSYRFGIYGEGNISAIKKPFIAPNNDFDVYPPSIQQRIKRINGRVIGSKGFRYYLIPKEPGTYTLGDYFQWVFFNPTSHRYDTLQAGKHIRVTGESQKNKAIESARVGSFYDLIDTANNTLSSPDREWIKKGINIMVMLALAATLVLVWKR